MKNIRLKDCFVPYILFLACGPPYSRVSGSEALISFHPDQGFTIFSPLALSHYFSLFLNEKHSFEISDTPHHTAGAVCVLRGSPCYDWAVGRASLRDKHTYSLSHMN